MLGGPWPQAAATVTDSVAESDSVPRLRWAFAIGCLLRYRKWRLPRDVPSLINLRQRIAEVGGALGPPIVKGGNPREARRKNRTLKQVDPCDRLIGVTACSSPL